MLEEVKIAIRYSDNMLDEDISDTIDAAREDLILSGITTVKAYDDTDPLIKRAIKTFCKAEYAYDENEAERYRMSYESLRNHLSLASDYTESNE